VTSNRGLMIDASSESAERIMEAYSRQTGGEPSGSRLPRSGRSQ
jgi:hypothetical protein